MGNIDPSRVRVGQRLGWSRTITEADIRAFAEFSGDRGSHHLEKDSQGRLMAHGLLTATLPTKLGGDLNFIAGSMSFQFIRPAYSGDTLDCVGTILTVIEKPKRWKVEFDFEIRNQHGKPVLKGKSEGMIPKPGPQ